MSTSATIKKELLELTSLKRLPKTPTLAKKVHAALCGDGEEADDELWDGLSSPTQEYVNALLGAAQEGNDLPEIPEDKPAKKKATTKKKTTKKKAASKKSEEPDEEDEDEEEEAPKKGSKKKVSKKKTAKKKAPAKKTRKAGGPTRDFREVVCRYPNATVEEIREIAEQRGIEVSDNTITTVLYHTRSALEILAELGYEFKTKGFRK